MGAPVSAVLVPHSKEIFLPACPLGSIVALNVADVVVIEVAGFVIASSGIASSVGVTVVSVVPQVPEATILVTVLLDDPIMSEPMAPSALLEYEYDPVSHANLSI